ncbi:MAG: DNA alkylation repair protein [Candidatus Zhuqueibacterota bacterium]
MNFQEAMTKLESLGTDQNQKIYKRHGAGDALFGVSFADLKALRKQVKTDHSLAVQLWNSGNHDAQIFATMIADPDEFTGDDLERWVREALNYMVADSFVSYVAFNSVHAKTKMEAWTESDDEWIGRAGWVLLAKIAMEHNDLPDSYFNEYIRVIEERIHRVKNRTREAMNQAIIAIGIRSDDLETSALESANRIGAVEIDHGDTSCKTPDASNYIRKTRMRRSNSR